MAIENHLPTNARGSLVVPLGFAAQIKSLHDSQQEQTRRISELEAENRALKGMQDDLDRLVARVEQLERSNARFSDRRRAAVSHFLNLRTLHQDASNAFVIRTRDIQSDDLEGILCVFGTCQTTVMNDHHHALARIHANVQSGSYPPLYTQTGQSVSPTPLYYAYPTKYTSSGYCLAHTCPYPCRACGP
ncbi:hypothetical protein ACN47E_001347 [Coniothyrium glycines]